MPFVIKFLSVLSFFIFSHLSFSFDQSVDFETAIKRQENYSYAYLKKNISPPGTQPGFVVASPSTRDPDYFFHWVRDAALVMDVLQAYEKNQIKRDQYLQNYVKLESSHQKKNKLTDQGEPKFLKNGEAFFGPWGRPQNDGPALRALTNIHFAKSLYDRNRAAAEQLYRPELPANSPIKIDLEYVSHQWANPDFDLWEEVKGTHFFTRIVQLKSLKEGAMIAKKWGDPEAAKWYATQQNKILEQMIQFWSEDQKQVFSTIKQVGGRTEKVSHLDASIILASFFREPKESWSFNDERIMLTFFKLIDVFKKLYPINKDSLVAQKLNPTWPELGVAIGRYPEDVYFGGQPWYLLTSTFAEFCYRNANALNKTSQRTINFKDSNLKLISQKYLKDLNAPSWKKLGDEFLARSIFHAGAAGEMAEQFDKESGSPLSAVHLSWSYAAYLSAMNWRKKL
ncbi:MAG: glycoside hydrolase family 15 protein [Bacteriovoracaceae bacterium]|nr:glycoside hydrolase family 15 protein [Bacteriovoracaceae bacterium]